MSGPRKIIDLDTTPADAWVIDAGAVHLYSNELWTHLPVGCVLCVEAERNDAKGQSLQSQDGSCQICLTHGRLEAVPYSITKDVTIQIGGITKSGKQVFNDTLLIPSSLSPDARRELFDHLINVAEEEERAKDILSDE